jgi:hypothetical protein
MERKIKEDNKHFKAIKNLLNIKNEEKNEYLFYIKAKNQLQF